MIKKRAQPCPVCLEPVSDGEALSDGSIAHHACLDTLQATIQLAIANVDKQHSEIASLQPVSQYRPSFLQRLFGVTLSSNVDNESMRLRLAQAQSRLLDLEEEVDAALLAAEPIYDLLLDYPPDWELRAAVVRKRDRSCKSCGSSRDLHVHHVVRLAKGGTNRTDNLLLLCNACHLKVHNAVSFVRKNSASQAGLAFAERIQQISRAIENGSDVEFKYKKPYEKTFKKRIVSPYGFVKVSHVTKNGSTLCLSGYCHLRRAERHFAIKRMKGLKIR